MIAEFKDIYNKDPFVVPHRLMGTLPATAANYGVYLGPVQFPCEVMEFAAIWGTASSSGTLNIEKLTGTTVVGNGALLLVNNISTAAAANTGTFSALVIGSARQLLRGDRLALRVSGTLSGLTDLSTSTLVKPLGKGHYAANSKAIL